jgi:beta-glucosidase
MTALAEESAEAIESRITAIIEKMTVEQKVGQMVQPEIQEISYADVTKYHIGSVLNGGGSFPDEEKSASINDWLVMADKFYEASIDTSNGGTGIPLIWGTDAVHGHNNVIGATLFPHNIGLGAANDPQLMRKIGEVTAREVAVTGIDWVFAPTVAVVKDNRWGRSYEGYSDDAAIIRSYAGEIVSGVQGAGNELRSNDQRVIATAKHFIGDGGTFGGVDQGNTVLPLDELLEKHGQGYISAIDAGVQTVMASFNSWNGEKLHGQQVLLTDVLKGQMGFDGFVIGDWNGHEQVEGCDDAQCAKSIIAGVDMIMVPHSWLPFLKNTITQVKSGEIPMARIDDAVRRILRVKIRAGIFEKGTPSTRAIAGKAEIIGSAEHRAVAREAVRKSLVLLKNKNQLLPLKGSQHVLVTGDGADNIGKQNGGWTITWQGTENENSDFPGATSIYAGLQQAVNNIGGSTELSEDGSWQKKPDVAVVVFGENPYAETQGDRESLDYKFGSNADLKILQSLKKQKIPVVAVFLTGRPMWVNAEINSSDAFVVAWLPGSEGGGVADVLVSDNKGTPRFDFTGRLSFNWPNAEINAANKDLPVNDFLLKRGQGLSYQDAEIVSEGLGVKGLIEKKPIETVVFSGSARPPWQTYVGDAGGWQVPVVGTEFASTYEKLKVKTVDGAVQEDSRYIEWLGGNLSQFYFQASTPVDLTEQKNEGAALVVSMKINKHPKGKVELMMDCVWPCRGALNVTRELRSMPKDTPLMVIVPLGCFERVGVDLTKVNSPLLLSSSKKFALTISDVRIVSQIDPGNSVPQVLGCK